MRRLLASTLLLLASIGPPASATAAPTATPDGFSVTISPTSGLPGTEVVVSATCGDPVFEYGLSIQFRAAGDDVADPFGDPRLEADDLAAAAAAGQVRQTVSVPADAAAGDSFFDVLCLNAEGGGIPGLFASVPFTVAALPATGVAVASWSLGGLGALLVGLALWFVARPKVSRHTT